ncbi:4a-hydroxytetrahydrobiopterin dehydratase [Niveibacterium terrae]|uniref:4a-hydroxytetrahydrobiopterin dehydratase n=1 Tax=Niveibacterium terrae TaxID=3373598 RepID=UPI003A8F3D5C
MSSERLTDGEREDALSHLPGWQWDPLRGAINRQWEFDDFNAAWGFLSRVALLAERQDHHPEILCLENRVELTLTTPDAGGVSPRDIRLALAVSAMFARSEF